MDVCNTQGLARQKRVDGSPTYSGAAKLRAIHPSKKSWHTKGWPIFTTQVLWSKFWVE